MPSSEQIHEKYVLKLMVNNHPGVMSHVCGLFARRGFNLDAVLVRPMEDSGGRLSFIWLLLNENNSDGNKNTDQIMKQTEKLEDVIEIERRPFEGCVFEKVDIFFQNTA